MATKNAAATRPSHQTSTSAPLGPITSLPRVLTPRMLFGWMDASPPRLGEYGSEYVGSMRATDTGLPIGLLVAVWPFFGAVP